MKKGVMFLFILGIISISLSGVFAGPCLLSVSLVNQDPYSAVQGDTVKLLFQVSGVSNPECSDVYFRLDPGYSFSLQGNGTRTLSGSTFIPNYQNDWLVPFTLNVNKYAPDGDSQVEVYYSSGKNPVSVLSERFNVTIQDSRADFEVYIKNYVASTNTITFQILNIAKVNVKAVTVTIPEQQNIQIKGANTNIVGDLDSNEYATADFEGTPLDGNISMMISYTDQAGVRRVINKDVAYDSNYFKGQTTGSSTSIWYLIIVIIIILLIIFWIYTARKKKKRIEEQRKIRIDNLTRGK